MIGVVFVYYSVVEIFVVAGRCVLLSVAKVEYVVVDLRIWRFPWWKRAYCSRMYWKGFEFNCVVLIGVFGGGGGVWEDLGGFQKWT